MAMMALADRFDKQGRSQDAEYWFRQAAACDFILARHAMITLANRAERAGFSAEATHWYRQAALAGDSSTMWILANRLEQAGERAEAEQWRRRALEAGSHFAVSAAIEEIRRMGGSIQEFERLMRGELGADIQVMQALTNWLDESCRTAEADQWLREAAAAGQVVALHLLMGRAQLRGQQEDVDHWRRRLVETGTWGGVFQLVQQLQNTDPVQAEQVRRYGIEPGGATADPW